MKKVDAHDILLFNLRNDPEITTNLAGVNREKTGQMMRSTELAVKQSGPLLESKVIRTTQDNSLFE